MHVFLHVVAFVQRKAPKRNATIHEARAPGLASAVPQLRWGGDWRCPDAISSSPLNDSCGPRDVGAKTWGKTRSRRNIDWSYLLETNIGKSRKIPIYPSQNDCFLGLVNVMGDGAATHWRLSKYLPSPRHHTKNLGVLNGVGRESHSQWNQVVIILQKRLRVHLSYF